MPIGGVARRDVKTPLMCTLQHLVAIGLAVFA